MTLAARTAAPSPRRRRSRASRDERPGGHPPVGRAAPGARVPLGRQPISTSDGTPRAYEFLYRSLSAQRAGVDRWTPGRQDGATACVLDSVFADRGVLEAASGCPAFVNVTRSYLVGALPLPVDPERLVLEIVESVPADAEVLAGVRRLRAAGYRIAIDDFAGLPAQVDLLPYADYVKVDYRDLARQGASLVALAARYGAQLVAERLETTSALDACVAAGFSLYQGDVLAPTVVLPGAADLTAGAGLAAGARAGSVSGTAVGSRNGTAALTSARTG